MHHQKDGQASLPELDKAGFKMFQSLLENLNIKLGTRHNTLYGARAMTNMLVIMAKNNVSANSAHKNGPPYIKIPSGDWLLKKLRPIEMDEMTPYATFNACSQGQVLHSFLQSLCMSVHVTLV